MFVKPWAVEDIASLRVESLTSVDWGVVAPTDKTEEEVAFGETMNVK